MARKLKRKLQLALGGLTSDILFEFPKPNIDTVRDPMPPVGWLLPMLRTKRVRYE